MISESPAFTFAILDPLFFESLDRYQPSSEFLSVVRSCIDNSWLVRPGGYWTYCEPPGHKSRAHGWKIHISASGANGEETLRRLVPLFAQTDTPFKYASDRFMLYLGISKNWSRTGAGKFITAYLGDEEAFRSVIGRCHELTSDLSGPFVLSDRPYPGSRVVFYRYGEHRSSGEVGPTGERRPTLYGPNGEVFIDNRQAYFNMPPWVRDPIGASPGPTKPEAVVLKDRYRVTGAERFSSIGGIYYAKDLSTGDDVVVREARPNLGNPSTGYDSVRVLNKEARVLQRLAGTGLVPRFIDLFQEWDHWFVVQERLQAESLWGYAIDFTYGATLKRRGADLFGLIEETIRKLVAGLAAVHEAGVVLRDLTKSNVMFTVDGDHLRFIDFELAYELDGQQPPVAGHTFGYASKQQLRNDTPTPADDHYAFGALILDMLAFTASGLPLHRAGVLSALRMTLDDLGLPAGLADIIEGLLADDRALRWGLPDVTQALDRLRPSAPPRPAETVFARREMIEPSAELRGSLLQTLDGVVDYIEAQARYDRRDRVWPASPDIFTTNPIGLQFGAAGTALSLVRCTGGVGVMATDWILDSLQRYELPMGLMTGVSGVAVYLSAVGRWTEAAALLDKVADTPKVKELPGLYHGAAGWGVANLHLWAATGDRLYLDRCDECAAYLRESAREGPNGTFWPVGGQIPLGLAHGASGVALFLAYLYAVTGNPNWRSLVLSSLTFEMANRQELDGRLTWFSHADAKANMPKSPHTVYGTAGIGTVFIRAFAATGEQWLLDFARRCAETVSLRFTNKIWYDFGLTGYGELLLDMAKFDGNVRYRHNAFYLAEPLLHFRMLRPEGIAFPGAELLRISCDYGQGSAGIAVFLDRLLNPDRERLLFPDRLLESAGRNADLSIGHGDYPAEHGPALAR